MAPARYSEAFKVAAVRHVLRSGTPVAEIARRLGVHPQTLRAWAREHGVPSSRDRTDPEATAEIEDALRSKDFLDTDSGRDASSTDMAFRQVDAAQSPADRGDQAKPGTGGVSSGELGIGGLAVPKASDVLAARLRDRILTGELREGRMLPVEREIADEAGLSRGTVREALRILELEGLVATKPGRAGGTVVQRPSLGVVEHNLQVFIRGRQVSLRSLLETREALEPTAAELAATNRTDEELDRLDKVTAMVERAADDVEQYLLENVTWHITVAEISHNELVHVFMRSLSTAIFQGTNLRDFNSEEIRQGALAAHRKVLRAVREQDPDRARRAMQRHVHAYRLKTEGWVRGDEVVLSEEGERR